MRGGSSNGSPMYQERYDVCAHVGQSSVMSARTRGGSPRRGAVARLPRQVAEQDVGLESLLEGLAFEQRVLERVAERADGVGEDVVEHGGGTLALAPRASRPLRRDHDEVM